jgi:hypothetical protein
MSKNDFKPSRRNPLVVGITRALLPVASRKEKLDIELTPEFLAQFRAHRDKRAMIVMNHADRFDPMVAFWLSALCKEDFYYLAARELFDDPFNGFFLQSCGTYSVIRGTAAEGTSAGYTIDIIAARDKKLVMFPEGDVTGRDNEILPLKKDGIGNILTAQQRVIDRDASLSVVILPVSIFYEYVDNQQPLVRAIDGLEYAVSIVKKSGGLEARTFALVEWAINRAATEYGIAPGGLSIHHRLVNLCRGMASAIAQRCGVEVEQADSASELLYNVRAQVRKSEDSGKTERLESAVKELDRIQQLLILASTLRQPFTLETCWRLVDRLEQEIFGKPSVKGQRKARIAMAEAEDLRRFDPLFRSSPEQAIERVEHVLRSAMQEALELAKPASRRYSGNVVV